MLRLGLLLFCAIFLVKCKAVEQSHSFQPITTENVDQLEFGYALPGQCGVFSPDSQLIATNYNGIFDLATGERRLSIEGYVDFSADGTLVSDMETGRIFDVETGELLFATEEGGAYFSPDSSVVLSRDGVYDVATRQRLYSVSDVACFSHTGHYLFISGNGLYETRSGELIIETGTDVNCWTDVVFSQDDQYVVINGASVYETETGIWVFDIEPTGYRFSAQVDFSPDSRYLAVEQVGVYSVPDGLLILETDGWTVNFSQSGELLGIAEDGVYEVDTWRRLFDIEGGLQGPYFSLDESLIVFNEEGIYRVATGEFFELPSYPSITPNSDMIIHRGTAIYDTETWEVVYELPRYAQGLPFYPVNNDQTIFAFSFLNTNYDVSLACMIYGIIGNDWPYRSGLVQADQPIPVYSQPDGDVLDEVGREFVVFSQTSDGEWYRVTLGNSYEPVPELWIRAADVTPISMPGGIPIENP